MMRIGNKKIIKKDSLKKILIKEIIKNQVDLIGIHIKLQLIHQYLTCQKKSYPNQNKRN
jgi:hypothetical protein